MQIRGILSFQKKWESWENRYSHTGKKGIEPWSYIIHKNQLKMDQTPKCKKIIKFKETLVQKHHDSRFGNDFLAVTPKAQAMKEKIR